MSLLKVAVWSLVLLGGGSSAIGSEFEVAAEAAGPPSAAVLASGDVVVAWSGPELAGGRRQPSLRVLDAEGRPRSQVVRLAPAAAEVDGPAVAALASGGAVAVWAAAIPETTGAGVWAQRVGADGELLGARIRVAAQPYRFTSGIAAAGLDGGGFVVVWRAGQLEANSVLSQPFDWQGEPSAGVARLSTPGPGYRESPTVVKLPDGSLVAVWEEWTLDTRDATLVGRRIDAAGHPEGPQLVLVAAPGERSLSPAVTASDSGAVVLAWHRSATPPGADVDEILVASLDPATGERGEPLVVASQETPSAPSVAIATDGTAVALWDEDLGIRGRYLAPGAVAMSETFRPDTLPVELSSRPAVVADRAGGFVAFFLGGGGIVGTRLEPRPSAGSIRLLDAHLTVSEGQAEVDVELLRSGGGEGDVEVHAVLRPVNAVAGVDYDPVVDPVAFAAGECEPQIARVRLLPDGVTDGARVVELHLDAATGGAVLAEPRTATLTIRDADPPPGVPGPSSPGSERPVAEATTARRWSAEVTAAGDDRYLVAWLEDGSAPRIRVRAFDGDGAPLGPPALAVADVGLYSSLGIASDGRAGLLVWSDAGTVYGRRLDLDGLPIGAVMEVAHKEWDDPSGWTSWSVENPELAPLGGGEYQIAWIWRLNHLHAPGAFELAAQRVSASDAPAGDLLDVRLFGELECHGSPAGAGPGGHLAVFQSCDDGDAVLRRWHDGVELPATPLDDREVSTGRDLELDGAGGLVAVGNWDGIAVRQFRPDGSQAGTTLGLNQTAASLWGVAGLTRDERDILTVVWESSVEVGPQRVVGRRATASGVPLGGEFRVSDDPDHVQFDPALASLADGRTLIAWTTTTDDGSTDVMVRTFAASVSDAAETRPGGDRAGDRTPRPDVPVRSGP